MIILTIFFTLNKTLGEGEWSVYKGNILEETKAFRLPAGWVGSDYKLHRLIIQVLGPLFYLWLLDSSHLHFQLKSFYLTFTCSFDLCLFISFYYSVLHLLFLCCMSQLLFLLCSIVFNSNSSHSSLICSLFTDVSSLSDSCYFYFFVFLLVFIVDFPTAC